jgi:hypothetical protein
LRRSPADQARFFLGASGVAIMIGAPAMRMSSLLSVAGGLALLATGILSAADPKSKPPGRVPMDLGPAVAFIFHNGPANAPLSGPDKQLVLKALSIRLGRDAGVCFDSDALAYAAGWTGGFIDIGKSSMNGTAQGSSPVFPIGHKSFALSPESRRPANGKFKGYYVHGEQVVLSYAMDGTDILDLPGVETAKGVTAFTRTLWVGKSSRPVQILVAENCPVTLLDPSGHAALETVGQRTLLTLPRLDAPCLLKLGLGGGDLSLAPAIDPEPLTHGGALNWTTPVVTKGRLGNEPGAYAVDTLTLPETNPWHSWMRISAMDFFEDGRCAVSTLSGDVWIVSGIDGPLGTLTWKRFATGLYEPLGLRILHGTIYVLGRDRVTRLHDLNADGEADFYESFNSDLDVYPTYHAFVFDLQTDTAGNFYFAADGNMVDPYRPKHGSVMRLSADGSKLEEFATGFRAPNGMSVGPNNEITCSDNQGHWTPASKISWLKKGGFYGYGGDPRQPRFKSHLDENPMTSFDPPLCWIPMNADNSSGGQIWVTSDRWGLPRGSLLHTSYGKCTLFEVMFEDVAGQKQGGVWQFPLKFDSGIMRGRFNPRDGQLYVAGLKGWQTVAVQDGALQRVRYTGKPLQQPVALHVEPNGIRLTFGSPLDPTSANDPGNYGLAQWNYRWTSTYGSDSWSVADPDKKGEDPVEVKSAKLSPDGKTVFLETAPLQPVMQMRIKYALETADGTALRQEIYNTINRVK